MSKKKKSQAHRGPREKRKTVRCVVCGEAVETTREDTLTCSPKCRKSRSRWLGGGNTPVVAWDHMPPKRSKKAKSAPGRKSVQKRAP